METQYSLKICAKGSRKTGQEFIDETLQLSETVKCIEIDFNYPHDRNFDNELEFLKKLKLEKGIEYTVHAQYFSGSINDFNEQVREASIQEIKINIDKAAKLGAKIVTIHPALEPYGLKIEKRKELEIGSYKTIAEYAASKGIVIGLENEAQTCFWFPDRACKFNLIKEVIEKVGMDNFLYTLDIGHANVSGEDYISAIKTFANKIVHIHAHDNIGRAEENMKKFNRPDPHLIPGKGQVDWKKVIEVLKEISFQGYFELECEIKDIKEGIEFLKQ
jgi:sugar phosphate isomerase/epimerase